MQKLMLRLGMEEDMPIESKMIAKRIAAAQKAVEAQNFESRKHLLEYDDVMNKQRQYIYGMRRQLLEGVEQKDEIVEMVRDGVENFVDMRCPEKVHADTYDLDGYRYRASLSADLAGQYSFDSVMPGHYPARVCQHIHYVVTAPGHKPLITQLYFATDPVFEGDPDRNYSRDPLVMSRELVRPVTLSGDPKAIQANVTFELVLERL